jgi:hypothetical protein
MDNYYKLKYLTYKIKYLKYQNLYGGKLICTCKIKNKDTKEETKELCECEIHDDSSQTKDKKTLKKIQDTEIKIQKLEKELETLKENLKNLKT